MNKKQLLRTACFLLLAALLLLLLCDLFKSSAGLITQRMRTYRDQERGAVDAVYIGSSAVDRYWIAAKAYEDYGMTVYPYSSDGAPVWLIVNQIREARKTQDPKLLILDIRGFTRDSKYDPQRAEVRSRRIIDGLPFFSANRLDAINRSSKILHEFDPEDYPRFDVSLFLPFIRFHDMWHEDGFNLDNLRDPPSRYLGFYLSIRSVIKSGEAFAENTEERAPLAPYNEACLRELIDYVKENELPVLFVASPHAPSSYTDSEAMMQFNTIQDLLEAEGLPFLFFNTPELRAALPLDPATEFYNAGHVNYWGAVKYTDFLAAYLDANYDLPDHRGDPRCESWNGVYAAIQEYIAERE